MKIQTRAINALPGILEVMAHISSSFTLRQKGRRAFIAVHVGYNSANTLLTPLPFPQLSLCTKHSMGWWSTRFYAYV